MQDSKFMSTCCHERFGSGPSPKAFEETERQVPQYVNAGVCR